MLSSEYGKRGIKFETSGSITFFEDDRKWITYSLDELKDWLHRKIEIPEGHQVAILRILTERLINELTHSHD